MEDYNQDEVPEIPGQIAAQEFVLVDAEGRVRMSLYINPNTGEPGLSMMDATGATRVRIGISSESTPMIALLDKAGKARLVADVSFIEGAECPNIRFNDGHQHLVAGLGINQHSEPDMFARGPEELAPNVSPDEGNRIIL